MPTGKSYLAVLPE